MGAAARWAMEATPAEDAMGTEDAGAKEKTAGVAGVAEVAIEGVLAERAVRVDKAVARGCCTRHFVDRTK